MTLKALKVYIEGIAAKQANIHTVVKSGDIYDLNTLGDVQYGAFCMTQMPHTETDQFRTYHFYLFVVDRLLADKTNKVLIQSNAIEVLSNIIREVRANDELDVNETINYTTFTQRFSSECAGAYCTLSITVPISGCYEEY